VLDLQIKSNAYERYSSDKKQNNFEKALPFHLAEQAEKTIKDTYKLDFGGIGKPTMEREINKS